MYSLTGAEGSRKKRFNIVLQFFSALALLAPWLNPFAGGPTPSVIPWLVSAVCFSVFLIFVLASRIDAVAAIGPALLAAAVISSVFGLLQYFGAAAAFAPWINTPSAGEAFANLRQRNQFATLTSIGMVALLWFVRRGAGAGVARTAAHRTTSHIAQSVLPVFAVVLLAFGDAASTSRTGMVQLILIIALFCVWGGWRQPAVRRVLIAGGLAYAFAAYALPRLAGMDPTTAGILARLQEGDAVCASRLTLWGNVLHLIAQKPWSGWGWGELVYAHFVTLYPGARFCDILDNAHNLPLHLAVVLGVPVTVLICCLGLSLTWRSKPWRESDPTRQMAWGVLAVIMLHSMLEYPLWYGPFQITAGLCVWILWSTHSSRSVNAGTEGPPQLKALRRKGMSLSKIVAGSTAVLLVAGVAYAAWDYHRIGQIYLAPEMRSLAYRENTMAKISKSWLFRRQVRFAELTTTEVTAENAVRVNAVAHDLLHFSPEGRVIEKLIDSALMLGREDEARFYLARYRAAFPSQYARWVETRGPSADLQLPVD